MNHVQERTVSTTTAVRNSATGSDVYEMLEQTEKAQSLDRLEIFLTPRNKFRYTLQRLRADLRLHFAHRIPVVRLYSPATGPRTPGDLRSLAPICSVGVSEILVERGTAGFTLPLGIKMRHVESGTYDARLISTDTRGCDTVLLEATFTVSERPQTEWLVPAKNVRLSASDSIRVTVLRRSEDGAALLYESMPLRIRHVEREQRHHYIFGRAGSRVLDMVSGAAAVTTLAVPFALIAWQVRRRVVSEHPQLAAARAGQFRWKILRYFAPAFFCDPSRWVYRNGELAPGTVFKLETLTPRKRPLAGRASVLLRQFGVDEWPQLALLLTGEWSLFGPRAFPNRDGLLAPDGKTVQNSRDIRARYVVAGAVRKPGALSMRIAITPRGSIGVPPWPTAVVYDYYDSLHWSAWHACRVMGRLALTFIWGEAVGEHMGRFEVRVPDIDTGNSETAKGFVCHRPAAPAAAGTLSGTRG